MFQHHNMRWSVTLYAITPAAAEAAVGVNVIAAVPFDRNV
jgi:NADH:ubiquinone oxidoreductase subunit K